jgi:hypothetical protein
MAVPVTDTVFGKTDDGVACLAEQWYLAERALRAIPLNVSDLFYAGVASIGDRKKDRPGNRGSFQAFRRHV